MSKCYMSRVLDVEGRENITLDFFYDPMIGNYVIPKCEMTIDFWNQIMAKLNAEDFDEYYNKGYCLFSHTYDDTDENGNNISVPSWVLAQTIE